MNTHLQRSMALAVVFLLGPGRMLCPADSVGTPLYLYLSGETSQQLSWSSIVGARYTVQASTDLVVWRDVDLVTATGATTVWADPFPRTGAKGFYRVVLPQPQVRRVEPAVVQSGAATTVHFIGECFASGGSIWIDGVAQAPGTLVFDSTTQLHATLTLAPGEHTVTIKDASGATLAGGTLTVVASASGLKIEVPPSALFASAASPQDAVTPRPVPVDPFDDDYFLGGLTVTNGYMLEMRNRVINSFYAVLVLRYEAQKLPTFNSYFEMLTYEDLLKLKTFFGRSGCAHESLPAGYSVIQTTEGSRIIGPNSPKPNYAVDEWGKDQWLFDAMAKTLEWMRTQQPFQPGDFVDPQDSASSPNNIIPRDPVIPPIKSPFSQDDCGGIRGPLVPAASAPAMPWRGDVPMDSILCSYSGSGLEVTPAGEVCIGGVDLALPGIGLDLVWARSYRSRLGADSALGMGWDFSYNIRARKDSPTQVTVFDGNGRADVFRQQASGAFECDERFESGALNAGGTVFTLTFPDGGKWEFGAFGALPGPVNLARIVTIRDRNDNTITCTYDGGAGRLLTVSDAAGRSLAVAYDGAGWIQSVTDSTGRSVVYTHDAAGDLMSVRSPIVIGTPHGNDFPAGKTISFTYSSGTGDPERDHNLLTITDALAQTPVVLDYFPEPLAANVEYDRVERARIGTVGQDIVFRPERVTPAPANGFSTLKTYINDRNGHLEEIFTDSHNRVRVHYHWSGQCTPGVAVTGSTNRPGPPLRPGDPAFYKTEVGWNSSSCWTRITQPRGNTIERHYQSDLRPERTVPAPQKARLLMQRQRTDAPGVYDQDEIMMRFVHDERFGSDRGVCFPTQIIDERGYATQLTYDTKANLTSVKRARVVASPAAPTTNTMAVADYTYNAAGQLTGVLGPHNGNQRRLDTYAYVAAGPQKGWLASAKLDDGGLNLVTQFERNDAGAVTRVVDPRGNDTLITRNALNQAVRIEGPLVALAMPRRQRLTIYFDANNRVSQVDTLNFDATGIIAANAELTTTIARDVLNLPTLFTEEIDAVTTRSTQLIYDAERNCTQVLLPMAVAALQPANCIAIAYDERDLPYTVTSAPGAPEQSTTRYDYDANANCTVITQGTEGVQPRTWTMQYSPFVVSALGYTTAPITWPSDEEWFALQPFDPRSVHDLPFAASRKTNSPATMWRDSGDSGFATDSWCEQDTSSGGWLNSNHPWPSTLVDPSGNELRLYRDPAGNGVLMQFKGELNDVPGGAGNVTLHQATASHDFANRPTTTSASHFALTGGAAIGDGSCTTSLTWTDAGALASVTDDRGNPTAVSHDRAGRVSLITDAKANTLAPTYDANSNVVALTSTEQSDLGSPAQTFFVTCAYDEANRPKLVADNMSNQTTLAYDSRSNVTKLVNPRGNATLCIFDGLSRRVKVIRDADGSLTETAPDRVSQAAYDLDSRVISSTDDNGNVTQYTHDPLNRVKLVTLADGTTRSTIYDVHHNAVSTTDANGTVITAIFDLRDRVTLKNIAPGPGVAPTTTSETFSYDGASHLTAGTSTGTVNHSFARTFDSFGRLLTESQDGVPAVVSTFDALGNRLTCVYPGGRVVTTTFDSLNRASVISDTTGAVATFKYIGPDRVERVDYGNGTRCDLTWNGIDGVPNAPGDFGWRRIARVTHTHVASATVIDDRSCTWDRNQNKTQRQDLRAGGPQLTHAYTYNALDQLTATNVAAPGPVVVRQTNYNLDAEHNRINVTGPGTSDPGPYTRNAVNPPGDAQMNQYTTSPLGAHTYDANGNQTARGGAVYAFDYSGRLVSVTGIPVPENYEYDSLGRRVKKIAGPVTTNFAFTGALNITQNQTALGTSDYVFNIVTRGPVTDAWLHTDDIGNTVALSDTAGAAIERIEYEDYGQPRFFNAAGGSVPSSITGNPWLFRVMRYESETGLYAAPGQPLSVPGSFDGNADNTQAHWTDPRTGQALQLGDGAAAGSRHFRGANPWSQ